MKFPQKAPLLIHKDQSWLGLAPLSQVPRVSTLKAFLTSTQENKSISFSVVTLFVTIGASRVVRRQITSPHRLTDVILVLQTVLMVEISASFAWSTPLKLAETQLC